jgi:hypothetical protein
VALAPANHVGDNAAAFALGIFKDLRGAWSRQPATGVGAGSLPGRIEDVACLFVGHVLQANATFAAEFSGPGRRIRDRNVAEFVLARFKNKEKAESGSPEGPAGMPAGAAPRPGIRAGPP